VRCFIEQTVYIQSTLLINAVVFSVFPQSIKFCQTNHRHFGFLLHKCLLPKCLKKCGNYLLIACTLVLQKNTIVMRKKVCAVTKQTQHRHLVFQAGNTVEKKPKTTLPLKK
jgi:hypothetical protein